MHRESNFLVSLHRLKRIALQESLSLKQLIELLGENSHHILIIFFCIPYLQPIPFPGLSSIFAFVILTISFFLLMQKAPWLPAKINGVRLKQDLLLKIISGAEKIWMKLEKVIYPRFPIVFSFPGAKVFDFFMVLISAILLSLPLPIPFSNFIPTLPIFINSLGHLEEDGLLILISYVLFALNLLFFASLGAGIFSGIETLIGYFYEV